MPSRKMLLGLFLLVCTLLPVSTLLASATPVGPPHASPASLTEAPAPASLTAEEVVLFPSADATVDSALPNANLGSGLGLDIGVDAISYMTPRVWRALLRFDLTEALPANAVVDSAQLELHLYPGTAVGDSLVIAASNVTSDWSESGVTWNNKPAVAPLPASQATIGLDVRYYSWDATPLVDTWREAGNFGLELRVGDPGLLLGQRTFYSRESDSQPQLRITYHLPAATPTATAPPIPTRTPTTFPAWGVSAAIDSWVDQRSPSANHGADTELSVGRVTRYLQSADVYTLLGFDLSNSPAHAWVLNARLDLYQTSASGPEHYTALVETLTGRWDEMGVTWANMPPAVDIGHVGLALSSPAGCKSCNVTEVVKEWMAGAPAYGFRLRGDGVTEALRTFMSRHAEQPPRLWVEYTLDSTAPTDPSGLTCDHSPNVWSNNPSVHIEWSGASDGEGSGVYGYSYQWSTSAATIPDATVDTTGHSVTVSLGDGQHWFHVRTQDYARNWSAGRHWGAIWIDTVAPSNPNYFAPSRGTGVWSSDPSVSVQWSGATDALGSGVYGYAVEWSHDPGSLPPASLSTTGSGASTTLGDGYGYLHVRTRDVAGNWAPDAAHLGPFQVDTQPPQSSVQALDAFQSYSSFSVSWSGSDAGSGLAAYDVQVQDNGGAWSNWQTGATQTVAQFTGAVGHTYGFRCRARDVLGHLEAYPPAADTQTRIGRDIHVVVQDENGARCPGAQVYRNQTLVASAGGDGTVVVPDCMAGDQLSALRLVWEQPGVKRADAWNVYQTSVAIAPDGTPQLCWVLNVAEGGSIVLTVRRDQPLVGFHIWASVQWDAPQSYLEDLLAGFRKASDMLYDVTDGQAFFEQISIADNADSWSSGADYLVYASNAVWPWATIGGIFWRGGYVAHFPRQFWRNSPGPIHSWTASDAYPTLVHEFGHYGLWLWDEYLDRTGAANPVGCATNFDNKTPVTERASIMFKEWLSSELCSRVDPNHHHDANTWQDAQNNGESTWETVKRALADSASPARWILRSPDDRGAVVPGPSAVPVSGWSSLTIDNTDTGGCAPFDVWFEDALGNPLGDAPVWLYGPRGLLMEGATNSNGYIEVWGAHEGDLLEVTKEPAARRETVWASVPVHCSPQSPSSPVLHGLEGKSDQETESRAIAPLVVVPLPEPFHIQATVVAVSATQLRVEAVITPALLGNPHAEIWQGQATPLTSLNLTYDPGRGRYTGIVNVASTSELQGDLRVSATDTGGHTVVSLTSFRLEPVSRGAITLVSSSDGVMEVVIPQNGLSSETIVSIQRSTVGTAGQGNLVRASGAYQVTVSTGQTVLNGHAVLHMVYDPDLIPVKADTLHIHRWDEGGQTWVALPGTVDATLRLVSAEADHLSTFALLGEPAAAQNLYLPVMVKRH